MDAGTTPGIDASLSGGDSGASGHDAAAESAGPLGPIPLPPSGASMGATVLDDGGVQFRVWAPSASAVSVSGDFGGSTPLMSEPNGLFSTVVPSAVAGQHYQYSITSQGQTVTRIDPRARALTGRQGESIIVDPRTYAWKSGPFATPAASQAIIYEMFVPAFNVPSGMQYGSFLSVIDKLDYLAALGINIIELMPSAQFGSDYAWGYNPVGYYAPQATYGAPDDLRQLVDAAHAHGIGVFLDVVYNHYSSGKQGLWCFDGTCPSDNGVYFFSDPTYASTPWGPRPSYSTQAVHDFLIDGLFLWLEEYRLDGFRWDSTANIRAIDGSGTVPGGSELMANANDVLHGLFPRALFTAEDYKGYAAMTAPTASGGLGFDSQWDGFSSSIDSCVSQATCDVNALAGAMAFNYNGVATHRVIFTEDHDIAGNGGARLPTAIDATNPTSLRARKGSMLAAGVVLTSAGIPMLLQGQELLETGQWSVNSTPPINWGDATTNAPILAFYTDALRLRRNLDGVSAGLLGGNVSVFHVNTGAQVLAWRRWDMPGDDVVMIANFSATAFPVYTIGFPATGVWHVRMNGDSKKYSLDFGDTPEPDVTAAATARDGQPASGNVALAPYSMLVLSR